nr:hypothetical protein [Tanacetum cinerariifolium]
GPKRQSFYGYASNKKSKHDVFSTKRIITVTHVKVVKKYDYGYLDEIIFQKEDQKIHKFIEGDFPRLNLRDIEDMLLLLVHTNLFNLERDEIFHLNVELQMFTRHVVILKWVEDLQLGVKSYQKKLNITRTETFRVFKIKDAFGNKQYKQEDVQELFRELFNDVKNIHEELAEYINTPSWNRPTFYNNGDDDDEDCTIAITLDFLITDSLIMGDEHLDTILEKKSNEFNKSSVDDLVPNPREFEDECECDVPDCDDSQTTSFSTFSNSLFDDSTSSDDESSHEEDIHEMIFKTYSNPLFDLDEEILSSEFNPIHNEDLDSTLKNDRFDIDSYLLESLLNRDALMISSLKIDSILAEFAGELIFLESIPPGIDEANCDPEGDIHLVERLLYDNSSPRPHEEFVFENSDAAIESSSPSPIPIEDSDSRMKEIDLSFSSDDPMPRIEDDDDDSERDILIHEELLDNYSLSFPVNESFYY